MQHDGRLQHVRIAYLVAAAINEIAKDVEFNRCQGGLQACLYQFYLQVFGGTRDLVCIE